MRSQRVCLNILRVREYQSYLKWEIRKRCCVVANIKKLLQTRAFAETRAWRKIGLGNFTQLHLMSVTGGGGNFAICNAITLWFGPDIAACQPDRRQDRFMVSPIAFTHNVFFPSWKHIGLFLTDANVDFDFSGSIERMRGIEGSTSYKDLLEEHIWRPSFCNYAQNF